MRWFGLMAWVALVGCTGADVDKAIDTDTVDTDDTVVRDADNDGVPSSIDCDDADPNNWPGNVEVCDGTDNDCDGDVDDDDRSLSPTSATEYFADGDRDGIGSASLGFFCARPNANAATVGGDCDDADRANFPGNDEACDGQDNDCDTLVDDDDEVALGALRTWYVDADGDGFGDQDSAYQACDAGDGVGPGGDCNDADSEIRPGAKERCNGGVDDDCDGLADAEDPGLDASSLTTFFTDADRDGYGVDGTGIIACDPPPDTATVAGDCNDVLPEGAAIYPTAVDLVGDGVDSDCDGLETCYVDLDSDGFGGTATVPSTDATCTSAGLSLTSSDCDDDEPGVNILATEVCNGGVDDDCSGQADDADPGVDTTTFASFWEDPDNDTFGTNGTRVLACNVPGSVRRAGDCAPTDGAVFPGAPEVCNRIDDDCDNDIDEADANLVTAGVPFVFPDGDRDGYGTGTGRFVCFPPAASAPVGGDCDDLRPDVNPDQLEVCDGIDNDCARGIDGADAWWDEAWPYRVPLQITAPATWDVRGAPVAPDIDFGALLAAVGDTGTLDAGSVRVVLQDCGAGQPEIPSEWMDDVGGVFDKRPLFDRRGDQIGALAFLDDTDGDLATLELLPAGTSRTYAVYFGSTATSPGIPAPAYSTTLVTSTDRVTSELSNARTEALFAASVGGLSTRIGTVGRPSTGAQDTTGLGNGVFFGDGAGAGAWLSARDDTAATLGVIHRGPIFGGVRAEGEVSNAWGSYDYLYAYYMFEGRPEVYVKVRLTLTSTSTITQSPFWGAGVRPWLVNNNALSSAAASEGSADIPGYLWARGTYAVGSPSPYGVAAGYRASTALRSRPVFDATGTPDAGRYVGLVGQDVTDTFASVATFTGSANQDIVDYAIVAVYPHDGAFSSVSVDFFGTLQGATTTLGAAEARP